MGGPNRPTLQSSYCKVNLKNTIVKFPFCIFLNLSLFADVEEHHSVMRVVGFEVQNHVVCRGRFQIGWLVRAHTIAFGGQRHFDLKT